MADGGGFFRRLHNLFRGFLNLWISDVEKEHPEIAYENAINSMIEKYSKLKHATAAIIRRRDELHDRFAKQSAELAQVSQDLDVAVQTSKDDLGLILIQKKNLLEKEVAELKSDLETAGKDADSAKAALLQVQAEIKKLQAEKDTMLAKMESAKARVRIQERGRAQRPQARRRRRVSGSERAHDREPHERVWLVGVSTREPARCAGRRPLAETPRDVRANDRVGRLE